MTGKPKVRPAARRVRCPFCGARRYNRCRNGAGEPVAWHHADRLALADTPAIGAPERPIPPEVRAWAAEGVPVAEIERRARISRHTLYRHGVLVPKVRRPGVGGIRREIPPEVHSWHAAGVPIREISRRSGIARNVLRRHGIGPRPEECTG